MRVRVLLSSSKCFFFARSFNEVGKTGFPADRIVKINVIAIQICDQPHIDENPKWTRPQDPSIAVTTASGSLGPPWFLQRKQIGYVIEREA